MLTCTGMFPVIKKTIQGIEHSSISRRRRRFVDPPGSRRRGNNAGWLGTWSNFPLRTDSTSLKWFSTNFLIENSSSRNSRSLQVFQLLNTSNTRTRSARSRSANSSWSRACSRLDCSYPVRVCPMSTAWESICLFNSQILFSARSALYSRLRISDFASASYCSPPLSKIILNWQLSNSWLDLRFCDIQLQCSSMVQQNTRLHRDPCLTDGALRVSRSCQNWLCTLKLSLLRVINLQQARTCFSLLNVQWWSQRIPGVLVVNLSIWVLRVVVTKVLDFLDIRALEEWSYFEEVFSQFSSWKFPDL